MESLAPCAICGAPVAFSLPSSWTGNWSEFLPELDSYLQKYQILVIWNPGIGSEREFTDAKQFLETGVFHL
jgi:hypothetical protein